MKKSLFLVSLILFAFGGFVSTSQAQDWVKMMQDPNTNFFEVKKAFNEYYEKAKAERIISGYRKDADASAEENNEENEIPGYTQYKRWEWFMAPRVSANGERFAPDQTYNEFIKYNARQGSPDQINSGAGNWTLIGPTNSSGIVGAGRINGVRVHPTDQNTLYVCTPAGGLWKSTNGGTSWTTNTDWVSPVIGCTDLAFDPIDPNIMYLATGDGDAGDTYSVGLLKSTDGGNTWLPTGLVFSMGNYRQLSRVLVNPNNGNIILVATSGGLYQSTDAGATFVLANGGGGGFKDMEFKPGDPNTVYACGTTFVKSTDGGATWNPAGTGLPAAASLSRMCMAVTPANAALIYLDAGLAAPYGEAGFYKSTNSGTSFSKVTTLTNMGTQQWYDFAIAASPTNSQEVIVGGQYQNGNTGGVMRTTNGGTSWNLIATGATTNGVGVHTDYHDCIFTSGTQIYLVSDGGIYSSSNDGTSWTTLNSNLCIGQMYGFGHSATNSAITLQGWQDNGTNKSNGSNFTSAMGGDGMLAFVSWNTDQNMWGSQYNGSLNKSTNGGTNWSGCAGNISGTAAWVTPWLEDPVTANTIYAGFSDVWKHTGGGGSSGWVKKSTFNLATSLINMAVSPANNQVMYATDGAKLFKTANGGTSWTTLTPPSGSISYIACSYTNANKAWIAFSGFTQKMKVYQTTDQGATWKDVSSPSLPNVPVDCIVIDKNANEGLYIGTDVGVFYKDSTVSVWQPFYKDLPNVPVTQLNIFYPTGKIRASTYGRGIWESSLYQPGSYPPVANYTQDNTMSCPGAAVQFTDYSSGSPTSWNWSFPGGSPSSSTQQNPRIVYNTPGAYNVSLIVNNSNGGDTLAYNNLITITTSPYPAPTVANSSLSFCAPKAVTMSATGSGLGTLRWWDSAGGGNQVGTGNSISPTLTATTSYYVDEDFPSGSVDGVGEVWKNIGTGINFTANDIRGLYFDVYKPVILTSVEVYCYSAGNRTIEVLDGSGNSILEKTVYMNADANNLVAYNLDFKLYPGKNYFIKCRGTVDLWRNDAGAVYPYYNGSYPSDTSVIITGSNANGALNYYYFFYNWTITEVVCNTARSVVVATDTCSTIGIRDLFSQGALEIYPNPNKGIFNLSFFVENKGNYKVNISNALGQSVYRKELGDFAGSYSEKIDIGEFGKGMYLLSVTNSNNETVKKVIVY